MLTRGKLLNDIIEDTEFSADYIREIARITGKRIKRK